MIPAKRPIANRFRLVPPPGAETRLAGAVGPHFAFTCRIAGSRQVHSGCGDVIKGPYGSNWPGFEKKLR
jgi:hypothetical protein